MTKRLFIFAGYESTGIVDPTLLHYIRSLSDLGDVVFHMDNDASEFELDKVRKIPNVLIAQAERHNEYDFGSYKRGYVWADDNGILKNYDWIYLVNDSVYGPLSPLGPVLEDLESRKADVTGMYYAENREHVFHVQSWFIGLHPKVALSDWFNSFMRNIRHFDDKTDVIIKYEFGLSHLFIKNKCKISCWLNGLERDDCMRNPRKTLRNGMPFIKKSYSAMGRLEGEVYLVKYVPAKLLEDIRADVLRRRVSFTRYRKLWDFRLFGVIPIIALFQENPGGTDKMKLMLFKYIKLATISF